MTIILLTTTVRYKQIDKLAVLMAVPSRCECGHNISGEYNYIVSSFGMKMDLKFWTLLSIIKMGFVNLNLLSMFCNKYGPEICRKEVHVCTLQYNRRKI